MIDLGHPIFAARLLDTIEIDAWRERLILLKQGLKRHSIEGDTSKNWTAGDHIKGSTSGGWQRIHYARKSTVASFTFASRISKDGIIKPYFAGSPSEIVAAYEVALNEAISDTTSIDGTEPDDIFNNLDTHLSDILNDMTTAIAGLSKDPEIADILKNKRRLESGAPFDFPRVMIRGRTGWISLLTEDGRRILQMMMKPIVMISASSNSRTLKFTPFKSDLGPWEDPGPMEKMRCIQLFTPRRDTPNETD